MNIFKIVIINGLLLGGTYWGMQSSPKSQHLTIKNGKNQSIAQLSIDYTTTPITYKIYTLSNKHLADFQINEDMENNIVYTAPNLTQEEETLINTIQRQIMKDYEKEHTIKNSSGQTIGKISLNYTTKPVTYKVYTPTHEHLANFQINEGTAENLYLKPNLTQEEGTLINTIQNQILQNSVNNQRISNPPSLTWWQKIRYYFQSLKTTQPSGSTLSSTSQPIIEQPIPARPSLWQRIRNYFRPPAPKLLRIYPIVILITPDNKKHFIPHSIVEESKYLSRHLPHKGTILTQKEIRINKADIIDDATSKQIIELMEKQYELSQINPDKNLISNTLKHIILTNKTFQNNLFNLFQQAIKWQLPTISNVLGKIILELLLSNKKTKEFKALPYPLQLEAMSLVAWNIEIYNALKNDIVLPLIKGWPSYTKALNSFLKNFLQFLLTLPFDPIDEKSHSFIQSLDPHLSQLLTEYIQHNRLPFVILKNLSEYEKHERHTEPVTALDFNSQGTMLIQGTLQGLIIFTNIATFEEQKRAIDPTPIPFLKFRTPNSLIIEHWNSERKHQLIDFNPSTKETTLLADLLPNIHISLSADKNFIGIATQQGDLEIIDINAKKNPNVTKSGEQFKVIQNFYSLAFFDSTLNHNLIVGARGKIQVWNPFTQSIIETFPEEHSEEPITALTVRDNTLISGSANTITIRDLKEKRKKQVIQTNIGDITVLTTARWNGRPYILCGGSTGIILIISLESGEIIETIQQEAPIQALVPHPTAIAFASINGKEHTAKLWELAPKVKGTPLTLYDLLTILHMYRKR